ncbi:caspase family protein [Sandaracinus amylolyticus]|uniref:caspase family protein n=1 Tax=Sandaracinus amylolyticus TaxID=927083 RepID=UPI001F2F8947|nr:caspase family protein [Sandaracinus amylolyticus]UJR78792.1 Putative membrane-associated, metal-dependent hydrolase [Sandaracinus amylolyticus]
MRQAIALLLMFVMVAGCGGATVPRGPARNARSVADGDAAVVVGPRRIALGAFEDALSPGDPVDDAGRHQRAYEIELDPSQRVRFRVPAGELDPMLRVSGPDGFALENDDVSPHSLDAMLEFVPPSPGTYRVIVTTAPPGQSGRFQLRVDARAPDGVGARMQLGQRVVGALGGAPIDPDLGAGVVPLWFEAQGGSIVRVRVTSREFDTIAEVRGPHGQQWINDDANDLGPDGTERALDSTLIIAAPVTGIYQLLVSAYGHTGGGSFQVTTSVRPPVIVAAGDASPAGAFAGPEGAGRVLGLYAGITEYVTHGRLYGCADDARLLGEAMRSAHLQRVDEQVVLTDAMATRAAFLDGIRSIASRAQPQDVVVVFWSGHGNVQPAANDPSELDGLDETIQMIDGAITDTELVAALDTVNAGTVVLALDSCHSGGFADDFVRRAGRVGLFSSDEDVLSDTAEPRRAGGYLSWYLRNGVLGHADRRPHDGVLYAGELTDYLTDGFVADHRLMNRDGSLDPMQRLVVRRGSVRWSDVLWVYPRGADLTIPTLPSIALTSPPP